MDEYWINMQLLKEAFENLQKLMNGGRGRNKLQGVGKIQKINHLKIYQTEPFELKNDSQRKNLFILTKCIL